MSQENQTRDTDFLSDRVISSLIWRAPAVVMVVAALVEIGPAARGVMWALSLSVFGVGCLANAMRCGRRHCFYTGPFFLVMALGSLLYGFGVLPMGSSGWAMIGVTTLVGAVVLTYLPERIWGKYTRVSSEGCL